MTEKTIIVLGCARSGTSMISGMIHSLGVDMLPSHEVGYKYDATQNPKGSFENINFASITVRAFNEGRPYSEDLKSFTKFHVNNNSNKTLWGFKSPLTYKCFDLFEPYLTNPHFIVIFRDINTNAKSWQYHMTKIYNTIVSYSEAVKVVETEHLNLINFLSKYPDISKRICFFEDIKCNPKKVFNELATFLAIQNYDANNIKDFVVKNYSSIGR